MKNYNSKIFWHFTGGPVLPNVETTPKSPKEALKHGLKDLKEAYNNLELIIKSKYLKASCNESIFGNRKTSPFCCVTDIPLVYLHQHQQYYGDVAIGFKSDMIYRDFNPVLYLNVKELYEVISEVDTGVEKWTEEEVEKYGLLNVANPPTKNEDGTYNVAFVKTRYVDTDRPYDQFLLNLIKPTKFSDDAGESFYQEREWRALDNFHFEYKDIAAIIVPESHIDKASDLLTGIGEAKEISLMSWEFLDKV